MQKLKFTNGDLWDQIGLGTWKSKPGDVGKAVESAIEMGYRHIDCAAIYMNEPEIGIAIQNCIKKGIVKREDLWITSKLWNNAHRQHEVIPALKKTLADLQLDYLDLYIIHWPVAIKNSVINATLPEEYLPLSEVPVSETWKGMEEAVKSGLTKHIGVSNFSQKKMADLLKNCSHKPEVLQVELHPYLQQNDLLNFCNEHGVFMTAYSPLGSGDRSETMRRADEPKLLEDKTILEIAAKHKASAAQILIAWHVHRGTTVIPKSVNPVRQKENLEASKIILDADDMNKIKNLDRHYRFITGKFFEIPGNGYVNIYDE
ncbi:MAG: aldo/keto reductase [Crocinitomicaceae bacterium]|nr:aldo/keto reductase [Crocinitomicaceae bacterium]